MTTIKLICCGARAFAQVDGKLTDHMAGVTVKISLNEEWDEDITSKFLRISCGGNEYTKVIDETTMESAIPSQYLVGGELLQIGVDGKNADGDIRIPSEWASCGYVADSVAGETEQAPAQTVVEQLNALINSSNTKAESAKNTASFAMAYANSIKARADSGEFDGADGVDGVDGTSVTCDVSEITGGHRVTLTDKDGSTSFDVTNGTNGVDGTDGTDGVDGTSVTCAVSEITGGHKVTLTDKDGDKSFDVMDGDRIETGFYAFINDNDSDSSIDFFRASAGRETLLQPCDAQTVHSACMTERQITLWVGLDGMSDTVFPCVSCDTGYSYNNAPVFYFLYKLNNTNVTIAVVKDGAPAYEVSIEKLLVGEESDLECAVTKKTLSVETGQKFVSGSETFYLARDAYLDLKVDGNQGAENAGKVLTVGADGVVVPAESTVGEKSPVEVLLAATQAGIITPVADGSNKIFTDKDGKVFVL